MQERVTNADKAYVVGMIVIGALFYAEFIVTVMWILGSK